MRNMGLFFLAALSTLILVLSLNLTSSQLILFAIISAVIVVGMIIKDLLRSEFSAAQKPRYIRPKPPGSMATRPLVPSYTQHELDQFARDGVDAASKLFK